ncbi:hypothetical protein Forpe1208_v015809 [Fusarium oxysporum f. sp. rapae]|uniref:Uncharacterized protein n=1 Tax=Fusarium oxysporum f. sp. rapae TaxID=485398 RepID=A0A8J5NHV5_FUSOX|nr:hypothetical protein Forpe1208_v015809 [Fusarium oxysporum f. sp. rapae]
MNTVRSFWLGWGSLCVDTVTSNPPRVHAISSTLVLTAGDAAYVLGKKSFDANKTARPEDQRKTKSMIETLEYSPDPQHHTTNTHGTKITTMDNERPVRMDVTSTQLQSCRNAPSPNHGPAT